MKFFKRMMALVLAVTMVLNSMGVISVNASEINVNTEMSKEEYVDSETGTTMPYRLYVP